MSKYLCGLSRLNLVEHLIARVLFQMLQNCCLYKKIIFNIFNNAKLNVLWDLISKFFNIAKLSHLVN
jgi:hypothetical protein